MAKKDYIRTTASIPREHYKQLECLAEKNKVSVAWVVRDAIEKYLDCSDNTATLIMEQSTSL